MKTEETSQLYHCKVCDRHFSSKNSLKVHLESHDKLKKYVCKDCGAVFHTQGRYYVHIRCHGKNSIICHFCGKTFYHNDKFKCHLRIHTGEKPFGCKHCPKKFASRDNLKRHDVLVHKNDNDFICEICTKKFVFYQNYLNHLRCHKSKKSFKCEECKKTMKSRSLLLRHMRVHTGKKPYKCEMCSASFSDSSNKKRHLKIHKEKLDSATMENRKIKAIISSPIEIKPKHNNLVLTFKNSQIKWFIFIKKDIEPQERKFNFFDPIYFKTFSDNKRKNDNISF